MGVLKSLCFFIVVEQIVFSNIQIIHTYEAFVSFGTFNITYTLGWIKLFTAISQIFVACILAQGLLEKKCSKFLPWLFINAGHCLILGVIGVIAIFDLNVLYELFEKLNSVVKIGFFFFLVMQWIIWIIVLHYYRHLKLKELKREVIIEQQKERRTKDNAEIAETSTHQVQIHKEKNTAVQMNRLYPSPSAPTDENF